MTKAEREEYKKKKKLYKKLGAEKFQGIVFQVESIKFKILKKLCPNYIKHYDKWCDFREKRVLKKATTDLEKEKIKENTKFLKMEMRREFNQEKNRNYHINLNNRPTDIYKYLEWNKKVHKKGLIKNIFLILSSTIAVSIGFSQLIPIIILELISAGINFECINIQNYNICRYKIAEGFMKKREEKMIQSKIEKYGEASEIIHKSIKEKEQLPTFDEIISNAKTREQLYQLRELILNEKNKRNEEKREKSLRKEVRN